MPDLALPNAIEQDTTADAVEVQQNYISIRDYINADLINRDGSVAMAAQLQLVGDPTGDQHAATKAYVDALMPVGVIMLFGGAFAPAGQWALCNGASLSTAIYPVLHSVLGFRYGGGGAVFSLPNFTARVPVGVDTSQTRFDATGKTGGSTVVTLPQHSHTIDHDHAAVTSGEQSANHTHTIDHNHPSYTTGSGGGHDHDVRFLNVRNPTTGSIYGAHVNWSGTISGTTEISGTGDGAHTHVVDLPASSGFVSGNQSPTNHTHQVDLGNLTGVSSGNTGTAGAEHLPPFVVVQYIIRVDQV